MWNPRQTCRFYGTSQGCLKSGQLNSGLIILCTPNPWLVFLNLAMFITWLPVQHLSQFDLLLVNEWHQVHVVYICEMWPHMAFEVHTVKLPLQVTCLQWSSTIRYLVTAGIVHRHQSPVESSHSIETIQVGVLWTYWRVGGWPATVWLRAETLYAIMNLLCHFIISLQMVPQEGGRGSVKPPTGY